VRFLATRRDRWRPLHSLTRQLGVYRACTRGSWPSGRGRFGAGLGRSGLSGQTDGDYVDR
jgi:hypothetical protein